MRRIGLRRALVAATALLAATVVGTGGLFAAWLAGVRVPLASGATWLRVEKLDPKVAVDRAAGKPGGVFFILLVGNDYRPGVDGRRGDALHLLGVNPKQKLATMLNIPRDTCWQGDKINGANSRGPRASADAVGGLVGVPVAYVVDVDFGGFISLVDGVGGVDVNVPTEMSDHFSGAYFQPGLRHMSGHEALAFSRDRHDFPQGDITRSSNQGSLILDAMRQLRKQMQNAPGEFKLLALLGRHTRLDGMGLPDLYRLGRVAFSLNPDRIRNVTIPVAGGNCLGLAGTAGALFADFRDDAVLQAP
jgi:LCP family protein required for cell wall assembly